MPFFTASDLSALSRASAQAEKRRLQEFSDALCQYVLDQIDKYDVLHDLEVALVSNKDPVVALWTCPVRTWTIPWSQHIQTRVLSRDIVLAANILHNGWNTEIGLPDGRWCSVARLLARSDFLDRLSEAFGPNFKVFWKTTDRIHTQSEFAVSKAVLMLRFYPNGRPHLLARVDHSTDTDYQGALRLRGHEPIRTPPSTPRLMSNPPPIERPEPPPRAYRLDTWTCHCNVDEEDSE